MDGFEIIDRRFRRFVLPNAPMERLADGFRWLEGPVWFADMRCLLRSDVPNDRILRWTETGGVEVFRQPAGFPNGQTRDREGRLITCSHHGRCVLRTELDGELTVLAERFDGKRLNSPNDIIVKSDGTVWFSDPPYGIQTDYEGGRQKQQQAGPGLPVGPAHGCAERGGRRFRGPERPVLLSRRAPAVHRRDRPAVRRGPGSAHPCIPRRRQRRRGAERPGFSYGNPGQRRRHSLRRGRTRLEQRR